jgi:uncharacterized protein YjiK
LLIAASCLVLFAASTRAETLAGKDYSRVLGLNFNFASCPDCQNYAGITFNTLTQTFFMTDNQADKLFELQSSGSLVRTIDISGLKRTGIATADAEGITWMKNTMFAIALHDGKEIAIVDITASTLSLDRLGATAIFDVSSGPGKPKGIAYSSSENVIYWVAKNAPMAVIKARVNLGTDQLETIWTKTVDNLPVADLADVAVFPPLSPNLFLISESSQAVMEVDVSGDGAVLKSYFSTASWPIPKAGGLAFSDNSDMVIVGKHVKGAKQNDFNLFSQTGQAPSPTPTPTPPPDQPLPDGTPPPSLNYIHPGSASQSVVFGYQIRETGTADITVYDRTGEKVININSGTLPPGNYTVNWPLLNSKGDAVASGMYFVLIKTPGQVKKEKVVVVR